MQAYRSFRRENYILTTHLRTNDQMLAAGDLNPPEHVRNREAYEREIRYLVGQGQHAVQQLARLSRGSPKINEVAEIVAKLGEYTTIKL